MMKTAIVGLLFVAMAQGAQCQLVHFGPSDPHYCDQFKVDPNLAVEQEADIHGKLIDETGAPFRNSPVELRILISSNKQKSAQTVRTDANGNFKLKAVKAGKYRLVASPTRAFQQPKPLRCAEKQCDFLITLKVNPTDLPDSQCPVQ